MGGGRLRRAVLATTLAVGLSLFIAGCSGIDAIPVTAAELEALKAAAEASPPLQAGEKVRIIVYEESSLTGEYKIDPSGFVSLPLAGTVKAAGLTPQQLEQALTTQFSTKYLKDAIVTVEVIEFKPFYILGEVEKPGAYPYTGGLNIRSAIAIAGGRTYRANLSIVLIQHAHEKELRKYDLNWSIPILPGDIIEVPRRYI
jgi:protein involved in polysaccharide export with SLBB domain